MPTYKVYSNANYAHMCVYHLRDGRLSLKAKGLLSMMLCMSEDWKTSISGFAAICKEGRSAISSAFKELEECGYVFVEKVPPTKGSCRLDYVYHIYEMPNNVSAGQDRRRFSAADNQAQKTEQNIYIKEMYLEGLEVTREEDLQVDSSSKGDFLVRGGFTPPTVDEIKAYCSANMLDKVDADLFFATYEAQGWVLGNGIPMTNWQAAVQKWNAQDRNASAVSRAKRQGSDFSEFSPENWRRG